MIKNLIRFFQCGIFKLKPDYCYHNDLRQHIKNLVIVSIGSGFLTLYTLIVILGLSDTSIDLITLIFPFMFLFIFITCFIETIRNLKLLSKYEKILNEYEKLFKKTKI